MKKFKYNPYFSYFMRLKAHLMNKRHSFKDPILLHVEDYLQYVDSLNEQLEYSERKGQISRLLKKSSGKEKSVLSLAHYRTFVKTGMLPFADTEILDAYFVHLIVCSGSPSSDSEFYPSFAENLLQSIEHMKFFFEVLEFTHKEIKAWNSNKNDPIVSDKLAKECHQSELWLEKKLASVNSINSSNNNDALKLWIDDVIAHNEYGEEVFLEEYEYDTEHCAEYAFM